MLAGWQIAACQNLQAKQLAIAKDSRQLVLPMHGNSSTRNSETQMTDEISEVLKQISALLQRKVEQHDETVRRAEEMRQKMGAPQPHMLHMREAMGERWAEMESKWEKVRQEESQFRERLLAELQRHNQLLESLLAKWADSDPCG
jgi:hypothetical protein